MKHAIKRTFTIIALLLPHFLAASQATNSIKSKFDHPLLPNKIIKAVYDGDVATVRTFLAENPRNVEATAPINGKTLLMFAALRNTDKYNEILAEILYHNPSLYRKNAYGWTIVDYALKSATQCTRMQINNHIKYSILNYHKDRRPKKKLITMQHDPDTQLEKSNQIYSGIHVRTLTKAKKRRLRRKKKQKGII